MSDRRRKPFKPKAKFKPQGGLRKIKDYDEKYKTFERNYVNDPEAVKEIATNETDQSTNS